MSVLFYASAGRRIAKKVDGGIVEKYLWQGLNRLLAVYDGSDSLIMRFEYADGRMPYALTSGGNTHYPTYDQVGSLKTISNDTGNIIKKVDYDSFGNITDDTNTSFEIPFGFAGGLYDRDTGLLRFGYRDYNSEIGRWTAKDPILFSCGDTDLYGYCMNSPVDFIDPSGLESPPPEGSDFWDQGAPGKGAAGGAYDFGKNYYHMRKANTIGADKYFHCMANCQSARRGSGGNDMAIGISETRELVDEKIKRDSRDACNADRAANSQGRDGDPNLSCKDVCKSLRPPGLNPRY